MLQRRQTVLHTDPCARTNLIQAHHLGFLLLHVSYVQEVPRHFAAPVFDITHLSQVRDGFLWAANDLLATRYLVGYSDQEGAETFMLPGREHEDAGEIVVIPRHLLLAKESDDLLFVCCRIRVNKEQIDEASDIKEDGLII